MYERSNLAAMEKYKEMIDMNEVSWSSCWHTQLHPRHEQDRAASCNSVFGYPRSFSKGEN